MKNESGELIAIPAKFKNLRNNLGSKLTPRDIVSDYNDAIGEEMGIVLIGYENGMFISHDRKKNKNSKIPSEIIFDELEYEYTDDGTNGPIEEEDED